MSASRDRKERAKRLGLDMNQRYQELQLASGPEETTAAATNLAIVMNENADFVIWVLKTFGGLNPPPPEAQPEGSLPRLSSALTGDAPNRVMGASGIAVVAANGTKLN